MGGGGGSGLHNKDATSEYTPFFPNTKNKIRQITKIRENISSDDFFELLTNYKRLSRVRGKCVGLFKFPRKNAFKYSSNPTNGDTVCTVNSQYSTPL